MKNFKKTIKTNLIDSIKDTWIIGSKTLAIAYRKRPKIVILHLLGALTETLGSVFTIYATAKLFSLLASYNIGEPAGDIWFWLFMDTVSATFIGLGFWAMSYSSRLIYFAMNEWVVLQFMTLMNKIDIDDFYNSDIRNQINKIHDGYQWQIPNLSYTYLELIHSIMRFTAIALVVAQISWWLILLIALFLIPSLIAESTIAKVHWIIWGEKGDNRHIFSGIGRIITRPKNQMELRSMQAGNYVYNKIKHINREFYARQEQVYKKASRKSLFAKFFEIGGVAISAIYILREFLKGGMSLDKFFFVNGALFRINGALNAIFGTLSRIQEPQEFTKSFFELIDRQPSITNTEDAIVVEDKIPEIKFENVSFKYPSKDTWIIENLNLTIKPGEHIALVGENGAGKTTLIKLLLRFYLPTSGKITVNDTDIKDLEIESWYKQLATLFQDFNQYPFPVDENIEIAAPKYAGERSRLTEAAVFGGVDEQIKKYKHGWQTVLDSSFSKGTEPSGGQWQRVALARAFYRRANLLILDEPTSAIDAKAEYDIFNNIFDHYQNKSVLIVSHRFSTVRRASRIVVLDKGNIIEEGSHTQLMKNKGLYHELFTKQAEGYKD